MSVYLQKFCNIIKSNRGPYIFVHPILKCQCVVDTCGVLEKRFILTFPWISFEPTFFLFAFLVICYRNAKQLVGDPVFTDLSEENKTQALQPLYYTYTLKYTSSSIKHSV